MKRNMNPQIEGRQFNCDECPHKEHPIIVVGSHQFSTDLLANYIGTHKPARTSTVRKISEIPPPAEMKKGQWRLIFIDCRGLSGEAIANFLQTDGAPYLEQDIIALFNLTPGNADIGGFIDLGVRGFFFETDQPEVILKGVCALKFGEMWVARGVLMEYISLKPRMVSPSSDPTTQQLTRREKDVLFQLASGATNEDIASCLFISPHTVKTHISHICKKLNVQNRLQAALWAAKYLK
ncbi:MAG: DNA-binding response regulator [Desulfobulbus sp.]|nr:MAG: DNA-binding response regulator [Desulfobulbus sp.]